MAGRAPAWGEKSFLRNTATFQLIAASMHNERPERVRAQICERTINENASADPVRLPLIRLRNHGSAIAAGKPGRRGHVRRNVRRRV
jgi:hypothetical protein